MTTVRAASSLDRLYRPEEAADVAAVLAEGCSETEARALAEAAGWSATFPIQRVRKGRRVEAICPMVAPSLAADAMRFAVETLGQPDSLEAIDALLRRSAAAFHGLERGDDARLRCLVVVLPGVKGRRLLEATSSDRSIKNELLREGILVGEFFPSCPFATTFNPRLFALRSPVTMVVLRTFIEGDWRFICREPAWQQTYREHFGEPPRRLRHMGGTLWRWNERIRWKLRSLLGRVPKADDADQ